MERGMMLPATPDRARRLALGTVQFGLDYGITNRQGQVPDQQVAAILRLAAKAGIDTLDTAAAYGQSEAVLGRHADLTAGLRIIGKLPPLGAEAITMATVAALPGVLRQSLVLLRRPALDGLLLHHGRNLLQPGGAALLLQLQDFKAQGLTRRIGVSVYDPEELSAIAERFTPDIVQLPCNLLDQRFLSLPLLARLRQAGCEIHARSLFLQGALLADVAPDRLDFAAGAFAACRDYGHAQRLSPLQACLGFGLAQPLLDRLVLGVTSAAELQQILDAADSLPERFPAAAHLASHDPDLLNPGRWPDVPHYSPSPSPT